MEYRSFFTFVLLSCAFFTIPFQFFTGTALIFLTVPWIMLCRLCNFVKVGAWYLLQTVFAGLLAFVLQYYALGAMLFFLCFMKLFWLDKTFEELPTIANFLHTLNVHCQHELKGFTIECVRKKTGDREYEEVLVFKKSSTVDQQSKHVDFHSSGLSVLEENQSQRLECHVFVKSLNSWQRILQKHQQLDDNHGKDDNHGNDENASHYDNTTTKDLSFANLTLQSGMSSKSWRSFVEDISAEIESHDKVSQVMFVTLVILVLCSVAFYELYGAINWLLPLHMTPPLFFNRFLQDKLKRKFEVIEIFGGSSLLGLQYQLSYHSVVWYSRSQDYILIKHRNFSNKELADQHLTLGVQFSTTIEMNESVASPVI